MKHINKIQKLIFKICDNNNTLITYKDCLKYHINFIYLKRLTKQKKHYKLANDVYSNDPYTLLDEMWYIQYKNRNFIFDDISAMSAINKTNEIIYSYETKTFKPEKITNKFIKNKIVPFSNWKIGIITITNNYNNKIKIYCYERILCNIIKNNENDPFADEMINAYQTANFKKLEKIMKLLNIEKEKFLEKGIKW